MLVHENRVKVFVIFYIRICFYGKDFLKQNMAGGSKEDDEPECTGRLARIRSFPNDD